MPLDQLTEEHFSPYLNQPFLVYLSQNETIELVLIKIRPINLPPFKPVWESDDAPPRRNPFSVYFRGPTQIPLPQRMYHFSHTQLGELENLFITAIGMDANGRYYEAVFN